jgi:hypothetical protein
MLPFSYDMLPLGKGDIWVLGDEISRYARNDIGGTLVLMFDNSALLMT